MEANIPNHNLPDEDPELQQMLAAAVNLGQGFTTQVYEEHKRRQISGEPPESYFKTEAKLSVAFAGKAKLQLPQREGYECADIETPPAMRWPEDSLLVVRHHVKLEKDDIQEVLSTYQVQRCGNAILRLTSTTEDITERNIWRRARDGEDPQLHDSLAVHLEIAGLRMARYSHDTYVARKEEEALGLHNGGPNEAQDLLSLLTEGKLQMPTGQQ